MCAFEDISPEVMQKAKYPKLEFGRGIIRKKSAGWKNWLLVTMPDVLPFVEPLLASRPAYVLLVETMDRDRVEQAEARIPGVEMVVGIGGGMVMDMAKYVTWKRGLPLVLSPSIASVDACVTNTIAVRDDHKVHYIGFAVAEAIVSDLGLMAGAPKRLNRAGIADIMSIHTGLFDWELAGKRGKFEFVPDAARRVRPLVDGVEQLAAEMRDCTDNALRWLIEAYAAENVVCLEMGHSRPEEGSEHFLAYNIEHRTGKHFVHGELVCLGIVLMTRLQGNQPERAEKIINDVGVLYHPKDLDLSREDVEGALVSLADYVKRENLFYSIADERPIDSALAVELCRGLSY